MDDLGQFDKEEIEIGLRTITEKTGYLEVFSVISLLRSTHLSHIARMIGKSKSTILGTLDSMREEEIPIIEIDEEKTLNTRGVKKFYQLSRFGQVLENYLQQLIDHSQVLGGVQTDEPIQISRDEYTKLVSSEAGNNLTRYGGRLLINILSLGSELNYYFNRSAARQYVELAKRVNQQKSLADVKIPFGTNFSSLQKLEITNFEQVQRLQGMVMKFLAELNQLQEEFEEENNRDTNNRGNDENRDQQLVFIDLSPVIDN